jgi:hypothetical protein
MRRWRDGYCRDEFLQRYPSIATKADVKNVELNDTPQPEKADFVDWYAGFATDGKDESAVVETLKALCRRGEKVTPDVVASWTQQAESKKDSCCEI